MKVSAKIVHARRIAEHMEMLIKANESNRNVASMADLFEQGFRKILNDAGENNNALIVLAEKNFDTDIVYPYFSFLPEDKRLV